MSGGTPFSVLYGALGDSKSPRGNTKMEIRGQGGGWRPVGVKGAPDPLHRPGWICKTDPWCLTKDKLWHGLLFRCANLWMAVIVTWNAMKSIPSPVTREFYGIFPCRNRKTQVMWDLLNRDNSKPVISTYHRGIRPIPVKSIDMEKFLRILPQFHIFSRIWDHLKENQRGKILSGDNGRSEQFDIPLLSISWATYKPDERKIQK